VINRQKIIGWVLVFVAGGYLAFFLKTRLLTAGLPIEKKEWVQFVGMVVCLVLGTINVRLAALRATRRKPGQSDKT
jgi:hypothetical protein